MPPTTKPVTPETIAQNYQRYFEPAFAKPASAELFRRAELRAGERVLDLACGTGYIARTASEIIGPDGKAAGVDIAPNMIACARALSPNIEWHIADARNLPFTAPEFDAVLCQMALMFIDGRDEAAAEMHRVLVPGGRAVISTPGRIQPVFEHLGKAVAESIDPNLGNFVGTVFSINEPEMLIGPLRNAKFEDVSTVETEVTLRLPKPETFFWQYINMTPMAPIVATAPADANAAAERKFVGECAPLTSDEGMVFAQPVITAAGRKRAE